MTESTPVPPLDVPSIRAAFPALAGGVAYFDGPGGSQVPYQVAEAVAAAILFAVMFGALRQRSAARFPPSIAAAMYLIGSGTARLLLEPFRSDSTYAGAIAIPSLWATVLLAAGGVLLCGVLRSQSETRAPVHPGARETTHA